MKPIKLFSSLRQGNRQFAIIGLGRFGIAVCETLHKMGYEVLGTDVNNKLVAKALADKIVSNAIELDSTDPNALIEAGIFEFDTVVVAIGNYLKESIITTLNLKEGGVNYVVAKASSETHGKILTRVGADLIIFPESDAGHELAHKLTKPSIVDRFDLDPDHSIVEIRVPDEFNGKTLAELQIRSRYKVNVLAIGNEEKFRINPEPTERLYKNMIMVIIGSNQDIQQLPNLT